VINPTNPQNLSVEFVTSAILNAAEEWDRWTSKELMNNDIKLTIQQPMGSRLCECNNIW
jgi:hypothetical protein